MGSKFVENATYCHLLGSMEGKEDSLKKVYYLGIGFANIKPSVIKCNMLAKFEGISASDLHNDQLQKWSLLAEFTIHPRLQIKIDGSSNRYQGSHHSSRLRIRKESCILQSLLEWVIPVGGPKKHKRFFFSFFWKVKHKREVARPMLVLGRARLKKCNGMSQWKCECSGGYSAYE